MAHPNGDSFTLWPGFMSGPQMRPGMSSVNTVSAKPCTKHSKGIRNRFRGGKLKKIN